MAIRVRWGPGRGQPERVALCAAETKAEPGDIYLDDGVHYALYLKFDADRRQEQEYEVTP